MPNLYIKNKMNKEFFPPRSGAHPMIYAYEESNPEYKGLLKIGYTTIGVEQRIAQQYPTKRPDGKIPYRIVFAQSAMYPDGGNFTDHDVRRCLEKRGFQNAGGEWLRCCVEDLKAAYIAVRDRIENAENRSWEFAMRPEQEEAVSKTIEYYQSAMKEKNRHSVKFLWNAKMRFGKTFAAYQLAKRMNLSKILILTFKPAVLSAWEEDIQKHVDFEGWQFIGGTSDLTWEKADKSRPIVCFGSFQDYLGVNETGGIKEKNEWVHTTNWFLPNVASCFAMNNLLRQRQNSFFHDYAINVCAGRGAGIGVEALFPVQKSMGNPLETKTITLTCGKLTTGVTVKPWTGIFMLRNLSSPETYFQAAFRVQSPWEIDVGTEKREIMKHECYIFDFALDRALRQISDYSCRLDIKENNPEKKVAEFINFLPVIAYDGSTMKQIDAVDVLDITTAGISATLLARRWESALLVNVDNATLKRLMDNDEAMRALMNIEGFRSLNNDIEKTINLSDSVKKAKAKGEKLTPKEKKELTEQEKEYKSKQVRDFELLVSIGVFNSSMMNPAVWNFKRYEDSSLEYTGISKHTNDRVGGYDTVITRDEYDKLYGKDIFVPGQFCKWIFENK